MAAILRILLILLAAPAGAALAGGGVLMVNSILSAGGSSFGVNFAMISGPLSAIPIAIGVIWLFAWSRTAFGAVRHPLSATLGMILFLLGAGSLLYAIVADMPFGA